MARRRANGTLAWHQWRHWRDTHVQWLARWHNPRGRQTRHALPDGSTLQLDALGSVEVRYFATRREVRLAQGAAFFEVARDPQRPFAVQAGEVRVVVLGTRFGVEVSPLAEGGGQRVTVQVESGRVRVEPGDGLRVAGAEVQAHAVAPGAAAAWRHGELVFTLYDADWNELGTYDFTQGGYAVWNAMVQYHISPRWTVSLNLNNVFDKVYYQTVGYAAGGNYYGTPRQAVLTLRGTF